MLDSIPVKGRIVLFLLLALVGLILMIIGITRLYHEGESSFLLNQANEFIQQDSASQRGRGQPLLRHSTLVATNGKQEFQNLSTVVNFPFENNLQSSVALSTSLHYHLALVELANFPPKLDITTIPVPNSPWIVQNTTGLQLKGSPLQKHLKVKIFCQNSSCDAQLMGKGFCTDIYTQATFDLPTKKGETILSCQQGVSFNGFPAGFCGTCDYVVQPERYCTAFALNQTSSSTKFKNGDVQEEKPVFEWTESDVQRSYLSCPPAIATKYNSGLKKDGPGPSTINVTIVDQNAAAPEISTLLYLQGPCSPFVLTGTPLDDTTASGGGMSQDMLCFPKNGKTYPSHGAGIALVFFGVLFILIGLVMAWLFKLKLDDDLYHAVPDGWRSVGGGGGVVSGNNNNNNNNAGNVSTASNYGGATTTNNNASFGGASIYQTGHNMQQSQPRLQQQQQQQQQQQHQV